MILKFLKRLFRRTDKPEVVYSTVENSEDAIMKNALLALKTGKVVYGEVENGVLISRVSQEED